MTDFRDEQESEKFSHRPALISGHRPIKFFVVIATFVVYLVVVAFNYTASFAPPGNGGYQIKSFLYIYLYMIIPPLLASFSLSIFLSLEINGRL